jgi:hypothetical protein
MNLEILPNYKTLSNRVKCDHYKWDIDANENTKQEFEDCISLKDAYWYGGAESYHGK